jgi:DNA invertase Pin-like site-specific DNA recombinase
MMDDKTTTKCAIYVRVSKGDQDPEHQIKACKTYAFNQNYNVHKIYIDETSGAKSSRPSLNQMMFDMRNGLFNCVIVWKLDRLGRSLQHLLHVVDEFEKRNIDFICTSQNFDTSTSHGKLVFRIIGAMAEFERELISERTKEGLKHAENVGKRGKDKRPRKKGGYYLRYASKKVRDKYIPPSI